jgi:RNA polymerase sigma factor (sigma-70 family)
MKDRLKALFLTEAPKLRRFLKKFGSADAADDMAQEAFARLCAVDEGSVESPRALLFQTARNLGVDEYRRRQRSPIRLAQDPDRLDIASEEPNPEEQVALAQTVRRLRAAMDSLPVHKRTALMLFKVDGYSYKEIGARLGVSPRTVERYVADAIAHCHKELRALRED